MPRGRKIPIRDLRTYGRSRAVRLADFDYAGDAAIHLTIDADAGTPFDNAALARVVCDSVEFYCRKLAYRLYGFTLMPKHLHALLSPADSRVAIKLWLERFKSFTGHEHVKLGGRPPLWQRSANDHVCRTAETAEVVLAYIANNPVRAGLVERWQDWPWAKVFVEL